MDQTYAEADIPDIARTLISRLIASGRQATVLALQGDLGAGKTTLTKTLAQQLGVAETVVSPTFVIAKFYNANGTPFDSVVHIDAYRIDSLDELDPLGWEAILQQPKTLVIVEWPERIAEALPQNRNHFSITHEGDQRRIREIL